MRSSVLGSLASALVLAACSQAASSDPQAATPADAETPAPESPAPASALTTTACRFLVPKSAEGKTVRCADVSVPEDRRTPGSRELRLHVAVVSGKPGGTPTIELNGGPGGGADGVVGGVVAREPDLVTAYGKILEQGDVVFFDQRGTGRSIPRLSCSEDDPDCAKSLAAKASLAAYDTQENADDVAAIAAALGAKKVNLHGISYGTRLALETSKRHPDLVNAMIVDGVMPPDVTILGGFEVAADHVISEVFARCMADDKCNATWPDNNAALADLAKKLDTQPLDVTHPRYGKVKYDWSMFLGETMEGLYIEGQAEQLPRRIHQLLVADSAAFQKLLDAEEKDAEAKDDARRAAAASDPLQAELEARLDAMTAEDMDASGMAMGMYMSVTCNDYLQHESLDAAKTALAQVRPELVAPGEAEQQLAACKTWPTRASDSLTRTPSTFAGPTLVIGGILDPATPFTWAKHAAESLPNKTLVLVPDGAHGLMDACGGTLKGTFLAHPGEPLDASCATNRTVTFTYPAAPQTMSAHLPASGAAAIRPALRPLAERLERLASAALTASAPHSAFARARAKAVAARAAQRRLR